jgi:hypothetical protein
VIIQTVMVVALFGAAFWTGILNPMREDIKTIQRDINTDHAWTQKQDVQIKHLEEAIVRIDQRHEAHVVPRSENDIRLGQIVKQQELLGERLNELRSKTLTSVTVGDDLKRLNSEIADLRRQLQERRP